jgi:hypothetical protein
MRVRSNPPERLVIADRPRRLVAIRAPSAFGLSAGAFAALAEGRVWVARPCAALAAGTVALFGYAVERVWLVLDRAAGTVDLRRRNPQGFAVARFPLADFERIDLQRDASGDGGPTSRLTLRRAGHAAPILMTRHLSGGGAAPACVAAARAWLAAPPRP